MLKDKNYKGEKRPILPKQIIYLTALFFFIIILSVINFNFEKQILILIFCSIFFIYFVYKVGIKWVNKNEQANTPPFHCALGMLATMCPTFSHVTVRLSHGTSTLGHASVVRGHMCVPH